MRPHTWTLATAAMQPYSVTVCRYNGLHPCNYTDYYLLTNPKGWKAELAWLADP